MNDSGFQFSDKYRRITIENLVDFLPCGTLKGHEVLKEGKYPLMNGGAGYSGYYNSFNYDGNIITISHWGSSAGYVHYHDQKVWANNACWIFRPKKSMNCDIKYLYYFLKMKEKEIMGTMTFGGATPNLSKKLFLGLEVVVPPVEDQKRIINYLDLLSDYKTKLIIKLSDELLARKKQYDFYRDELILKAKYPRVKLSSIATDCFRGAGIKRDEVTEEGTPCVRYGEIYTTYGVYFDKCVSHTNADKISSKKILKKNDLLFAITGEIIEDIAKTTAYIGDEDGLVGGDIVVIRHKQNAKYLSYALSTLDAVRQKGQGKVKSKVVHSNAPSILSIEIPLPPLEQQIKIVELLDNFNALTNDISEKINSEINERTKQYNYYLKKLFLFKELKS